MPTAIDPILPASRRSAMQAAGLWRGELALDRLGRWIARTPDRPAVVGYRSDTGARTKLTYKELGGVVDRLAAGLARLGIGKAIPYPTSRRTGGSSRRCISRCCGSVPSPTR